MKLQQFWLLCHSFNVKNQTLSIFGCAPWSYYELMWLAAKGALACQPLEHVKAASFAIQLLAESKDD